MSFDLFPNEQLQTLERATRSPSTEPEPGIWHNFLSGTGTTAMMGAAQVGRAVDIAGAVGPIIMDKLTGGTTEQDKYFQEHDAVFNRAVDYWTPQPGEVGAAGKAVGSLMSIIPQFVISPPLAVATTGLSTAEDLTRQGIDMDKAITAGMVQGTGLGLGMWLPIFGKSWATKAIVAGAAGNIAQGIATTAATRAVLKGTSAEAQFNPWDLESIVVNGLMGMAFGTVAHMTGPKPGETVLSSDPAERSRQMEEIKAKLTPTDVDAITAANAAMHTEHTTAPGRPVDDATMTTHAEAITKAIDDLLNGKAPEVEQTLGPQPEVPHDPARPIEDLTLVPKAFQAGAIGDAVMRRLLEAGVSQEEARANGTIWESFFNATAKRYNVPPADILNMYGVDIRRMASGETLLGALDQKSYIPTDDPAFREAFKNTVLTKSGEKGDTPMVVYHGTADDVAPAFDVDHPNRKDVGWLGTGVYLTTSPELASSYSRLKAGRGDPNVMPLYANLENPYYATLADKQRMQLISHREGAEAGRAAADKWTAELKAQGHDGVILEYKASEVGAANVGKEIVVFDPAAVKSAVGNRGTWDMTNPNILYQGAEWYYSELARKIDEAKLPRAPAKGWKDYIRGLINKGVKGEEIEATGINEWLDLQEGRVTKEQVQAFLKQNGVKVTEKMLGGHDAPQLTDPDIAHDQAILAMHGWRAEVNPEDPEMIAFSDPYEGDFFTSSEIRSGIDDFDPADRLKMEQVARAAENIERYWRIGGKEYGPTRYGDSTLVLPGGQNYRELLLTLPPKDPQPFEFKQIDTYEGEPVYVTQVDGGGAHLHHNPGFPWKIDLPGGRSIGGFETASDAMEAMQERAAEWAPKVNEPKFTESHHRVDNVLAHVRFNERTDEAGKRVLFVEEYQSDWAQKGRERGFKGSEPKPPSIEELKEQYGWKIEKAPETITEFSVIKPDGSRANWLPYLTEDAAREALRADYGIGETNEQAGWTIREMNYPAPGPWEVTFKDTSRAYYNSEAEANQGLELEWRADHQPKIDRLVPSAPFVTNTPAWTTLVLKRMIRYAAENGFDKIAWTRGEQQVERYTSALRDKVDFIEWEKTDKGVQLVGYKGSRMSEGRKQEIDAMVRERLQLRERIDEMENRLGDPRDMLAPDRRRLSVMNNRLTEISLEESQARQAASKVVDTTEAEDALSDAIGKALADQIKQSPDQKGVIEGDNLKIDSTGMAGFYDRMVPNIANKLIGKMGGGRVGNVEFRKPTSVQLDFTVRQNNRGLWDIIDPNGDVVITESTEARAQDLANTFRGGDMTAIGGSDVSGSLSGPTSQHGFDITPAMKEKALAGLPLFQSGAKGQIQFGEGKTVIGLFENADRSTFLHETGHFFLNVTRDLATARGAPEGAVQDWATLADWLKIEGGEIPREAHEKFARGFEAYVAEGVAPNAQLRTVFQQFRDWLLQIYEKIERLGAELTDPVRRVMDRMLESQRVDPTEQGPAPWDDEPAPARFADSPQKEIDQQQVMGELKAQAAEVVQQEIAAAAARPMVPPIPDDHKLPPAIALRLTDQDVRTELAAMAKDAGWAQIGGRLMDRSKIGTPSFTSWIPRAQWWIGRPDKMSEGKVQEAVRKTLAGEKLRAAEERTIAYMLNHIDEVMGKGRPTSPPTDSTPVEEPFTRTDMEAAGIDRLRGREADAAVRLADEMHGEVTVDWSKLTEEQKNAELDTLFGPIKEPVAARAAGSEVTTEGTAGPGESPAARAAAAIADRIASPRADLTPIEPLPPKPKKARQAAEDGEQPGTPKETLGEPGKAQDGAPRDPILAQADRYLEQNPDLAIETVGPDGKPTTTKLKDELQRTREAVQRANDDAKLYAVAAECLIGSV